MTIDHTKNHPETTFQTKKYIHDAPDFPKQTKTPYCYVTSELSLTSQKKHLLLG